MDIKISLIMPCYNSEAYVKDAIESVINQTYKNFEFVIVNDGSTDNTLSIINSYAINDDRIKIISKENGGYATAINVGLNNITGDYFLMMGSDDALESNLFENLVKAIEKYKADIIAFKAIKTFSNGESKVDELTEFNKQIFFEGRASDFEKKYINESKIFFIRDTAKCYKSSLSKNIRYFGRYGYDADGAFSSILAHLAKSFCIIPVNGYLWTIRDDSVSGKKPSLKIQVDRIEVWSNYFSDKIVFNDNLLNMDYFYILCGLNLFNIIKKEDKETYKNIKNKKKNILKYFRKNKKKEYYIYRLKKIIKYFLGK